LLNCLEKAGICILHAPLFHPAMKNVGGIRRELGVKTFFNMLGPMVNPAFPKFQMVGVFNLELARAYGYLYQRSNKKYTILHALDGYDEVSLTSNTKAISNTSERLLTPQDFGVSQIKQEQIFGGDTIQEAAQIFKKVISGQGSEAQNNVVCANAAVAISTVKDLSIADSFAMAKESLQSGKAHNALNKLITLSEQ
jgi:anthranilate phosphoribosyltransferase